LHSDYKQVIINVKSCLPEKMKYSRPDLHLITADIGETKCVSGSGAQPSFECNTGPGALQPSCESGTGNLNSCNIGTAADSCISNGNFVGFPCYDGNNASFSE
jgi:hypothetical protein